MNASISHIHFFMMKLVDVDDDDEDDDALEVFRLEV
jgi:hypothetical protein